ncbi:hypothetical protein FGL97_02760 [Pseudomonas putida]|nr:hypothetical protein [Pseudomonas putida]NVN67167.1 hypothetical protein [Pseudomonas putida]
MAGVIRLKARTVFFIGQLLCKAGWGCAGLFAGKPAPTEARCLVGTGLPAKGPEQAKSMVSNLPLSAPAMQQLFSWRSAPDGFSGLPHARQESLAASCAGTRPMS